MTFFLVSLIVAFVAGIIALAVPCCFSVLLPSYFSSAFKRRSAVFRMTLVFAAGIAAVLLPIALGASAVAQALSQQHGTVFVAGGFLMLLLGMLSLGGRSMLPQLRLPLDLKRTDASNVFMLGAFSGVASSCCAPVLAGILVLAALTSSLVGTLAVALAYVAGMVFPLALVALAWDQRASKAKSLLQGRMVRFRFQGRPVEMHSSNLIAGSMFLVMGVVTIALGLTNTMITAPGADTVGSLQLDLERRLAKGFESPLVAAVGTMLVAAALALPVALWLRRRGKRAVAGAERAGAGTAPPAALGEHGCAGCEPPPLAGKGAPQKEPSDDVG